MKFRNRAARVSDDMALISGIQKYLPNVSFLVGGQSTPAGEVTAKVQTRVDANNAVFTAEAAFHGAVRTGQEAEASSDAYVTAIRQQVLAMFAGQPEVLAEFRLSPRKQPVPRTAEQLVIAAAKAKATREARGTKGPKARLEITGTVQSPIVIPVPPEASVVSTPTASAPAPAPAAPAAPAATPATNGATPQS